MQEALDWISRNYFENAAVVLAFVAVWLQIKQNVWYWLVSIIVVCMYIHIYIEAKLYADMSLQVYFLIISFYGWYLWLYGVKKVDHIEVVEVTKSSSRLMILLGLIAFLLYLGIYWILAELTDSDVPGWDAFTTALSFVATWMLARKKLENWLVWIVVDAVSTVLYVYKGLYPSAVLFLFLTFFAWVGYGQWMKTMKIQVTTD